MNNRDAYLDSLILTEPGKELLYTLAQAAPDIVLALRADAEAHRKIHWEERYSELMELSKKVCKLAQATGKFEDL